MPEAVARSVRPGCEAGPAIGEHRVIGDGRSAALIRPDGEIDWWCAPDMDSPPVLWSLLDPDGPSAKWVGARMAWHSAEPAGPTARTSLVVGGRRVESWDGLVGGRMIRLVRGEDADVAVEHELGGGGRVLLCAAVGRWAAVALDGCGGQRIVAEPEATRLAGQLATAERAAALHARLPHHHPERAADALAVLRACTYEPAGSVAAALTTSLPEAPGGDRNFDYRGSWLRDASLAVSVASLLGQRPAAERYLAFARGVGDQPVTDLRGRPMADEREVDGVRGWMGSRPVRVGNAARSQVQHDGPGLLLEAISVHLQTGGSLDGETWETVRRVADRAAAGASDGPAETNGVWEFRDAKPLVSGDIGRWLALDRATWIARGWRPCARRREWKQARAVVRDRVLSALGDDGSLPQWYGQDPPVPDASALMAVVFGMLSGRDPRAAQLVDWVVRHLEAFPFLYRYPPGAPDGFSGREGVFVPVSWWAVDALAATGRYQAARERADAMCAALPRLLAEEFDVGSGQSLGNVPLVWSHAEAARTMYLLDAEARRRRVGRPGLWAWRLGRYARLRWGSSDG